jgi:hypothetical protein
MSTAKAFSWKVTPTVTHCTIDVNKWVKDQSFFTDENDPETNMRGTRFPVILTPAVFADCVEWRAEDASPLFKKEKQNARLWDLLWMCSMKVNETRKVAEVGYFFQLCRLPNGGVGEPPMRDEDCVVLLRAVYSVNDHGETILTVSLPEEVV